MHVRIIPLSLTPLWVYVRRTAEGWRGFPYLPVPKVHTLGRCRARLVSNWRCCTPTSSSQYALLGLLGSKHWTNPQGGWLTGRWTDRSLSYRWPCLSAPLHHCSPLGHYHSALGPPSGKPSFAISSCRRFTMDALFAATGASAVFRHATARRDDAV